MDWLVEDQAWDQARDLLGAIPPVLRTDTQVRRQRLVVLDRAGLPVSELDAEWDTLLHDFPEEVPLHVHRYDLLRAAKRLPEARAVLHAVRPFESDNPYLLARQVEVLAEEKRHDEALEALHRLFFAQAESSTWPADYAWDAIKKAQLEERAYQKLRLALENGSRPTFRAFFLLSSSALGRGQTQATVPQPRWRVWFPDRGARELVKLLELADRAPWIEGRYRAQILDRLSSVGYYGLVLKYWKKHKSEVEADVATWAETARALASIHRMVKVRELLSSWRTRPGVEMWVVATYVQSFSLVRRKHLREIVRACRDALTRLPHDHCARFLVHVQAEACVLLGDTQGFRETWDHYRSYFEWKETGNDWFEDKRRHLLSDIPKIARFVEQGRVDLFRRHTWSWRWKHASDFLQSKGQGSVF